MSEEPELSKDNPFGGLPVEVMSAPVVPLAREDTIRMAALGMAVKYYTETIIKDGSLYQQKKLEGANLQQASHQGVLRCAVDFERYLRGDYAEMVNTLVDSDFNTWLRDQIEEAAKRSLEEIDTAGEASP